jgi:hypothetical protein
LLRDLDALSLRLAVELHQVPAAIDAMAFQDAISLMELIRERDNERLKVEAKLHGCEFK